MFLPFQNFVRINIGLNNVIFTKAKLPSYSYTEIPLRAHIKPSKYSSPGTEPCIKDMSPPYTSSSFQPVQLADGSLLLAIHFPVLFDLIESCWQVGFFFFDHCLKDRKVKSCIKRIASRKNHRAHCNAELQNMNSFSLRSSAICKNFHSPEQSQMGYRIL